MADRSPVETVWNLISVYRGNLDFCCHRSEAGIVYNSCSLPRLWASSMVRPDGAAGIGQPLFFATCIACLIWQRRKAWLGLGQPLFFVTLTSNARIA